MWICNVTVVEDRNYIWRKIAPLSCDRARAAMEAACLWTAEQIRFRSPRISQTVVVMVLDLAFYTKDSNGVGGAVNIFLFPGLTPAAGYKSACLYYSSLLLVTSVASP